MTAFTTRAGLGTPEPPHPSHSQIREPASPASAKGRLGAVMASSDGSDCAQFEWQVTCLCPGYKASHSVVF